MSEPVKAAPNGSINGTDEAEAITPAYVDPEGESLSETGDTINAGGGNDTVIAGAGADSIIAGEGADLVQGNDGADTIRGDDGDIDNDAVAGGQNDTLLGGAGNDVIHGEGGNDLLYGGADDDNLSGSLGNDTLLGEGGNDTLAGGDGSDLLVGEAGNDYIWADANEAGAADTIVAGTGNDTVFGGYGDDQFSVEDGHGTDILVGGEVSETLGDHLNASWVTTGAAVTFTGGEAGTLTSGGETLTFADMEQITTGSGKDTVDASAADDPATIATGAGDDQITGGSGDDTLTPGTGADTVAGGKGDDLIQLGGDGEGDTVVLSDGEGNDTLTGFDMPVDNGDGTFTVVDVLDVSGLTAFGGAPINTDDILLDDDGAGNAVLYFPMGESITLMGVAPATLTPAVLAAMGVPPAAAPGNGIVEGTAGGETIGLGFVDADGDIVDDSGNAIEGRDGADSISAGEGDDTILAGAGADTVRGNGGADQIFGDGDNDELYGKDGNDSLWGGSGEDTLFGNNDDDKLIGNDGDDLLFGGPGDDLFYGDGVFGDNGGRAPGDAPEPGFGNDTLVLDEGNDSAYGGSGDDTFRVFDGFGNHLIVGGETGEGDDGDRIDASAVTTDLNVVLTGDEEGTISRGGATSTFEEIERTDLGSGDDTVNVVTSTTGTVNGSTGFDTLELPVADPGDPAPVVTVTSETPFPGIPGATTKTGYVDFPNGDRMYFENFEEIICFTPGTLIDTLRGRVAVETLVAGDKVLTRDHGFQPLAWTGRRDLSADEIARCPSAAPIRIAAGALGKGLPERDLLVSPRHRMLIAGARAELMFGEREVLVAAADLLGLPGVSQELAGPVSYIHVMCDAHQIIRAEGAWSESFQPAEAVLNALDAATRAELLGLFPELATAQGIAGFDAARPVLNASEVRALLAA